ncbi:MAG: hypothetical protein OES79_00900 [Planctomycetota bacterium]|nr:hypothetical protein [Planctomycetota bacterium]
MLRWGRLILVVLLITGGLPRMVCCCTAADIRLAETRCPHCAAENGPQAPAEKTPCQCPDRTAAKFVATKALPVDAPVLNLAVCFLCECRTQHSDTTAGGKFAPATIPAPHSLSIPLLLGHLLF